MLHSSWTRQHRARRVWTCQARSVPRGQRPSPLLVMGHPGVLTPATRGSRTARRRPSTSDSRALSTASVAPRPPHNPAREATGRQQGRRSPQLVRPQPPSYVQPRASCACSTPPGRNAPHPVRDIPATCPGRAPAALPRPNKHKPRNSNSEPRRLSDG